MTDAEKWRNGIAAVTREFSEIDPERLRSATCLVNEVISLKGELAACFEEVGGCVICADCRGECCRAGRYHFTVVDLLSYLIEGRSLFIPHFESGMCPFLGEAGCLMEPRFRPYNCVTFVCERVDAGMEPLQRQSFISLSEQLLGRYRSLEGLFANRFQPGFLNNYDRFTAGRSAGVLVG